MIAMEFEHDWNIEADVSVEYSCGCFSLKVDQVFFTVDIDRYENARWRWRHGPFASTRDVVMALVRWDEKADRTSFTKRVSNRLESFADCLKSMIASLNHQVVRQVSESIKERQERDRQKEVELLIELRKEYDCDSQYVYLFRHSNGLTKIGMSRDPAKREKTLQAEDPRLHMLAYRKGGSSTESRLHRIFADRRVRGEWFDLSEKDVDWLVWLLGFQSGWDRDRRKMLVTATQDDRLRLINRQLDNELA